MTIINYQAASQPSFWDMLMAQAPHLALTLVSWPMFSSLGAKLAAQVAARWPQFAGMAQHIAGAVPLAGTSVLSTAAQYFMGDPLSAAEMQKQMALQQLAQAQQRRQQMIQQLISQGIPTMFPQQ